MDATVGAGKVAGGFVSLARDVWRSWRYSARASLSLDWDNPVMYVIGEPYTIGRAVRLTLTAPKHEELVVGSGFIEARKPPRRWRPTGREWTAVAPLESRLSLPTTVSANRQEALDLGGSSLVSLLKPRFDADQPVELRITMADFHRARLRTTSLTVTCRELARQERRL